MPKILSDPKENMLREVERLLAQGGYAAVTIRAVAAGCGVGVGTVYNYFPSKEAMLAELLLEDWLQCVAAIGKTAAESATAEPVAECIHTQLLGFAARHGDIFGAEAAAASFSGSFGPYHAMLRSQLAAPLRSFCGSDFAAEFMAEALLTWTMAGVPFARIWQQLSR